ncbi:probable disease resistance protein At1g61310 [Impatiens glandulifera]|uniref:probable disease resistance protein At1g61310 n=1 Tax=Impatiens glandulifera TaxID=253017 RepID=UPI001FB05A69|nr:probable disease resistance protein At1g61310 [Impatiens glandulifera]
METACFSTVGKMAEWTFQPILREFGYLLCFNSNIQELQTQLEKLNALRNDVQAREDAAKRMWQSLGEAAELWMNDANEKIVEAESVLNDKAKLQKGCFSIKWCPNLILRFSLGRKGKKSSLVLIELLQSGGQLPHTGHILPMPSINMRDYNGDACDFDSRSKNMEDIIKMLHDEETMLIGICGMGGIGKTTFAKQVLQKVKDFHKYLFEIQVISIVSSSPNFNSIQQEVAEMLGFSLKDVENKTLRAERLRKAFCNKKVVVLLDDVWKDFDLKAFGFPSNIFDVGYNCKIIYTSRNKGLWSGERNITKKEISLKVLSREEAWNLFSRKVNLPDDDKDLHWKNRIAMQIVGECGRLPLALEVVGGALIEKDIHEWNNMFSQLRNHGQDPHMEEINKALKTSYNFLEDPNAKLLFLLYRYAVGLHLFTNINVENLKRTKDYVYTLVDNLIRRNLLIKVEARYEEPTVKMHDLLRDVGISIAKQENNGIKFLDCDSVDKLENVMSPDIMMISILFQKDLQVFEKLEFRNSKLELLRLDSSGDTISGSLFQGQDNLKVLDIVNYGGMVVEFPYLAKLKMLSLEKLSFDMTPLFLNLKCLEILSLQWLTVQNFPNEISELTNLRLLDLTGCKCFIINGVLSRLTNLQELYMWDSFQDWRLHKEDVNGGDNIAAGLDELNCLHKLWRLELEIPNIEQVPRGATLFSSPTLLTQFKIRIGGGESIKFESGERQLWLKNVKGNTSFFHELEVLTKNDITNLYICADSNILDNMHINNFISLKDVVLKQCGSLFPLSRSSLKTSELGCCLRRIELYECNEMTHLFSTSISKNLANLQVLVLEDCKMMEEVISSFNDTEQVNKIEFNALETIKIHYLSWLKYFCKRVDEIHFHKLKILKLKGLNQFIFPTKLEIPCLEKLSMIFIPNIETLCVPPSLQKLNIDNCDNFQYVDFSPNSVISHLENVIIKRCKILKGVVGVTTGAGEQRRKSIEFPNLSTLNLESLDKLTSFVIHINNLDDKDEKSQNALFYHNDYQLEIPCLEKLSMISIPNIETLCVPPSLQKLNIDNCDNFQYVDFSPNSVISHLENVIIKRCKMLKGVVGVTTGAGEQRRKSIEFPNLSTLNLESLDKLTSFVIHVNNLDDKDEKSQNALFYHNDYQLEIPCLKELSMISIPNIETLCVPPSLQKLNIDNCDNFQYVDFSPNSVISHLENVIIKRCKMLKGVVGVTTGAGEQRRKSIEFPNLSTLNLEYLDKLTSFFIDVNNLDNKDEKSQSALFYHNDYQLEIPCLKELCMISIPNIETLCMPPSLQKLFIGNCDNSQYVDFSPNSVISHLKKVIITRCKMLKGVVGVTTAAGEQQRKSIEFPNLLTLKLESLDKLTSFVIDVNNLDDKDEKSQSALFYHNDCQVSFPSLLELRIEELPKINYILGQRDEGRKGRGLHPDIEEVYKIFPVLCSLRLYRLSNLIHMYEINEQPGLGGVLLFQNLTYLDIYGCGKLRYLFSENIARVIGKRLIGLEISNCEMMEVVIKNIEEEEELIIEDDDDKAGGGGGGISHFFPLLRALYLMDLSGLRSFSDVAYTWELPSLKDLIVLRCPKLEALSPGYLDSPRLESLQYNYREEVNVNVKDTWKGDVNSAVSAWCHIKVLSPSLIYFVLFLNFL